MNDDNRNRIYDEIAVGARESFTRTMTATEIEALALVAGEMDEAHLERGAAGHAAGTSAEPVAPGAAAIALVSNLLLRRLPGPGTMIAETALRYAGRIVVGDVLTASVEATARHDDGQRIDFACHCANQRGETLVDGRATVIAPRERVRYSEVATPELILRRHDAFVELMRRGDSLEPVTCAVVHPVDRESLIGAIEAARRRMIVPVLVGPGARIRALAQAEGVDLAPFTIVSTEHSHAAAAAAVSMARAGKVDALMKGSLHTDELMAAVVATDTGLRTARRISHVFVMDVPTYPRMLMVTDAAVNIAPDLETKADIVRNAVDLARALGIDMPRVAVLSAVETINPRMASTLDAAALCKMADRGQITGCVIDGPLAFDNAISEAAASAKGIVSPVAGRADILVVPDIEAGNMLAKQLQYLAGAGSAGIVLGARVPIVLTSRADSVRTRLASAAVMKLVAHGRRKAAPIRT